MMQAENAYYNRQWNLPVIEVKIVARGGTKCSYNQIIYHSTLKETDFHTFMIFSSDSMIYWKLPGKPSRAHSARLQCLCKVCT
jgi:hypothetical protein